MIFGYTDILMRGAVVGLLDALLGNAKEIDAAAVQQELGPFLIKDEQIALAYKLVRDLVVLTNRRMLLVDKQGISGKKTMVTSLPYSRIVRFARESAGTYDLDAELYIWTAGGGEPLKFTFGKGVDINRLFNVLSYYVQ